MTGSDCMALLRELVAAEDRLIESVGTSECDAYDNTVEEITRRARSLLAGEELTLIYPSALDKIHLVMDGEEWDSGTCSAIAEILQEAGYEIRECEEVEFP